jgi:hypothetical protein
MSAKTNRRVGNWRTPRGYLMRVVLHLLVKRRHNKAWVVSRFKVLFPDFQDHHAATISDGAIWSRATAPLRPGYEAAHPGYAAAVREYLGEAQQIVAGAPTVGARSPSVVPKMIGFDHGQVDVTGERGCEPVVVPFPRPRG